MPTESGIKSACNLRFKPFSARKSSPKLSSRASISAELDAAIPLVSGMLAKSSGLTETPEPVLASRASISSWLIDEISLLSGRLEKSSGSKEVSEPAGRLSKSVTLAEPVDVVSAPAVVPPKSEALETSGVDVSVPEIRPVILSALFKL